MLVAMDCIKISHILEPLVQYKIGINASNKSNLTQVNNVIKSGNIQALIFIVKYLNYYETEPELAPPEYPLIEKLDLKDLFELEEHIFGDLLDFTQVELLSNLINIAEELNMQILLKKLAAIFAYNMQITH